MATITKTELAVEAKECMEKGMEWNSISEAARVKKGKMQEKAAVTERRSEKCKREESTETRGYGDIKRSSANAYSGSIPPAEMRRAVAAKREKEIAYQQSVAARAQYSPWR